VPPPDRRGLAQSGLPQRAVQAPLETLGERIDRNEARQVAALLSPELAPFIATATPAERLDVDEFIERVAERERTDPVTATRHVAAACEELARTIEAVPQTLGERIAGGEVDHLLQHLPVEFHAPLKRGRDAVGVRASRMTLDKFLRHIAEREGTSPIQAALHARAVFRVLRDAVGEPVFRDVMVQLPSDYVDFLGR
jgi:uncharacterized protein (DUF2267 family)